ncbi:hypothetical protein [Metasolibacillus meyeri]|uniref:hypothetical protein n=1 Tax=Metasolibacillus meyeri TaxID=1071052 RepID=UPI00398B47CA
MINEKGEAYQFERDAKGQIEKEIGFDGMERTYERSPAGLVERILRPANRWAAYQHDALGNVITETIYCLQAVKNEQGHQIRLFYTIRGYLTRWNKLHMDLRLIKSSCTSTAGRWQ